MQVCPYASEFCHRTSCPFSVDAFWEFKLKRDESIPEDFDCECLCDDECNQDCSGDI